MSCCSGSDTSAFAYDSPARALEALCAQLTPVETESVPWRRAIGRVLAADATADRPSPAFDVSAMDGYALRWADCTPGVIGIAGEVLIGEPPPEMPHASAITIVTGAPVPHGADVIIRREVVVEHDGSIELPTDLIPSLARGDNIRRQGENMAAGMVIPCAGRIITAPMIGMLTGLGIAAPTVFRPVRVGIITTGDEVVTPETSPTQWQLRDGNAPALLALFDRHRWIEVSGHVHARDTADAIRSAADELLASCDALVLTGGVSMGDHDHVPQVVADLGAQTVFHRLPQRPGKPVLGAVRNGTPILGLPGNPVAVMVTGCSLVIPALAVRAGIREQVSSPSIVQVINADDKSIGLWWRRLVRRVGDDRVELVRTKGSGDVPSAALSDGFVQLPPGESGRGPWPFWSWSR